ncbi:MAG: arylesterase [Rhizobiaceae bacterium]
MAHVKFREVARKLAHGFVILFTVFAAATAARAQDDPPDIVVLGDSLVAGFQLGQGEGFPEQLQAALDRNGIAAKIIGAGVSGDTSSGGLSRLEWSVPDGTDAVIVELGANDALRGLPPETTRENIKTIIERLQERDIKVMLAGMMAPPNMGEDYAKAFNPIYKELAEEYGTPFYPFFLDGVAAEPNLNLEDGIHPNPVGVKVIVSKILPHVELLIEELRPSP